MAKYRKKPVVIEAMQFDGSRQSGVQIRQVWPEVTFGMQDGLDGVEWDRTLQIATLEGVMTASPGDFIIQGVKGEIYPCKPDIFLLTYEEAEG